MVSIGLIEGGFLTGGDINEVAKKVLAILENIGRFNKRTWWRGLGETGSNSYHMRMDIMRKTYRQIH